MLRSSPLRSQFVTTVGSVIIMDKIFLVEFEKLIYTINTEIKVIADLSIYMDSEDTVTNGN